MFGLGKKLGGAKAAAKKMENRDQMQALTGACLLIAAADGDISKEEVEKLNTLLRANPNLSHFGQELTETLNRFTEQLQSGFRVGKLNIMREIGDIASQPANAEEVFVNAITIAEGDDGDISAQEMKVLTEIGNKLNLRLKDFGIEG